MRREGQETSDLARGGQHPESRQLRPARSSRHAQISRAPLGILKAQEEPGFGDTPWGGLPAEGAHSHITAFPINRPVLQ